MTNTRKTAMTIALLYSLIASISTFITIGSQMLSMSIYKGLYAVEISILVGTAAGLPLRYLLEKRYIFSFKSSNIAHDGRLFVLYSFMGLFTTAIFWGTEYTFHLIFADELMRYIGGVIGLAIGFYVKYRLDKKHVFVSGTKQVMV
jgi:putative flippase GtrA